jgi:hypothetical protein|tara:strand:+ start:4210 stop:4449 length:240 start_codon:yes stop_codon:yes gene_type:complete
MAENSVDELKELLIDYNLTFLLNTHEHLCEKYAYFGLLTNSKSPWFIQTMVEHVIFENVFILETPITGGEDDLFSEETS